MKNFLTHMRTEDERYQDILTLTLKAYNLTALPKEYSGSKENRWFNILTVWDDYKKYGDLGVLYASLHKIFCGVFPDRKYSDQFQKLLGLVEEELLRDGEAFRCWSRLDDFLLYLSDVVESHRYKAFNGMCSRMHCYFLEARMRCDVLYSKGSFNLHKSDKVFDDTRYIDTRHIKMYETIVRRIIPNASSWEKHQWLDERNIYDELERLYEADYHNSSEEYDRLIQLLSYVWRLSEDGGIYNVVRVTHMPEKLMKYIWPCDTEHEVMRLFMEAYGTVMNHEMPSGRQLYCNLSPIEELKNSWLTQTAIKWISSGLYAGDNYKKFKQAVFEMGILP